MRKIRAQEVIMDLSRKGIKKIAGVKISDKFEGVPEGLDYDTIMNFYQNLLKKEKE